MKEDIKDLVTWDDLKADLDKYIRKSEHKKFNKEFKKIKKQLKKDVKNFRAWDYGFLLELIEHSLYAMKLYLTNKYLVVQDTECESNNWDLYSEKLSECYYLLNKRDVDDYDSNVAKALMIMSEYIFGWWD